MIIGDIIPTIERLAVNSWRTAEISGHWSAVSWQLFGVYRLALFEGDKPAADVADFLASLAAYRGDVDLTAERRP